MLERLSTLTAAAGAGMPAEPLLTAAVSSACEGLQADAGLVFLVDRLDGCLHLVAALNLTTADLAGWAAIPLDADVPLTRAVRERDVIWVGGSADRADEFPAMAENATPYLATASAPLIDGGDVVGVLGVAWRHERPRDEDGPRFLTGVAVRLSDALARLHKTQGGPSPRWPALPSAQPVPPPDQPTLEHVRPGREQDAADVLLRCLVPLPLPEHPGLRLTGRLSPLPPRLVGGDWYDAFPLPGNQLALLVGDASDHDPATVAIAVQLRSALRALLMEHGSPATALAVADQQLAAMFPDHCASAAVAVLEPDMGVLRYASAGHLPPLLATRGSGTRGRQQVSYLPAAAGGLLGLDLGGHEELVVGLPDHALLALFTDGLVERGGADLDEAMAGLAAEVAAAGHPAQAPGRQRDVLLARCHGPRRRDDAAVLILERLPD